MQSEYMGQSAKRGIFFDQEKIRRIHMIGAAGRGKTTLAPTLAAKLAPSIYHLDELYSKHSTAVSELFKLLSADVHCIATGSAWIAEGVFRGWTVELLQRADLIIWLDIPWYLATWQQLVRFVRSGMKRPSSRSAVQKVILFFHFLFWHFPAERNYYLDRTILGRDATIQDPGAKNRTSTIQCLAPYADKLLCFRRPSEIGIFLARL